MQMDGAALYAAAKEMQALLAGGRVERIAQPGRDEVVFVVRANGANHRLLFCVSPESARVHLTETSDKGPDKPFPFLMMLRKHLLHGRVLGFEVPKMDRTVAMSVAVTDDLGDRVVLRLFAECMGKHSNLILTGPDGVILDCAKRVPPAVSSKRTVLPGETYHPVPVQDKHDLLSLDAQAIAALLCALPGGALVKALVSLFYGISPFTAEQLLEMDDMAQRHAPLTADETQMAANRLFGFVQSLKDGTFESTLQREETGEPVAFAPFVIIGPNVSRMPTLCAAVALYANYRREKQMIDREKSALAAAANARLHKLNKRRSIQEEVLLQSVDFERLRETGEFMLAYVHQIERGADSFEAYDYIRNETVTLALDPTKSAAENAKAVFKRYQKLKASAVAAKQQLDAILPEAVYLEDTLLLVDQAEDMQTLMEIRQELTDQGLLRPVSARVGAKQVSKPLRFVSGDGVEIFAGRNNAQNDLVTTKLGRSTDTWLHAQGMAGSHVLIRANPVPAVTLRQAAQIAAYFSRGKQSANVPVDYTLLKHVRKPSGAKPGFVTYTSQKTLFVTPDAGLVKSLIREE
jgi:predicted ribosome quality control (RQC) complex YloA/Tae2 family protein